MAHKLSNILLMRYRLSKLKDATEEFIHSVFRADRYRASQLPGAGGGGGGGDDDDRASSGAGASSSSSAGGGSGAGGAGVGDVVRAAYARARAVYELPLTEQLIITGPAMAPTINRHGVKDPAARERLVIRLLRHPGPRNVLVGDVVAFHSPLATLDDTTHVMVRRVAAVEGQEMVSSSDVEPPFVIPSGHCWVLADNTNLRVEDGEVIDSRSYGHIPYTNVIGRVVYAAASRHDHRPVTNNPEHGSEGALLGAGEDEAVVAAEVDVEALFEDEDEEEEEGEGEEGEEAEEEEEEEQVEGEDEEDRERARRKRERERQAQQPDPAARLRRHDGDGEEEEKQEAAGAGAGGARRSEAAGAAGQQQQQQQQQVEKVEKGAGPSGEQESGAGSKGPQERGTVAGGKAAREAPGKDK
ncbi:hypothetical protein HYH02_011068 [Chlamydomonas schloesseri]|uniref:Mitochondrial inner membrane protease subunit 2 n=1 Tax=Chlamydomonas schloesseri TaxID=2026947 RepID=A0A835TC70_9CHLO|nr:hypothetical protein HYH02_011068 [Chlamydomonas schloesseri]|eukprot:KAG2437689.1 hypothetical protein HYH02_011068 [Chlamydomonas schloesseri]